MPSRNMRNYKKKQTKNGIRWPAPVFYISQEEYNKLLGGFNRV